MEYQKLVIANWKANKNLAQVQEWIGTFQTLEKRDRHHVICPPFPFLSACRSLVNENLSIGVQDLSVYEAGPYTGEVAATLLEGLDIRFAILGHSERRKYFGENAQLVARKVETALAHNITPIVCIDRDQVQAQADQIPREHYSRIVIAYEPVHAISSFGGHEDPIEVTLENIRMIHNTFGENVPVIYGGSVDPENSLTYLGQETIAGALVGKASLDPVSFAQL